MVNSKTPFHSARYIYPQLFTSPSGDSCIIFLPNQNKFFRFNLSHSFYYNSFCGNAICFLWESTDNSASMINLWHFFLNHVKANMSDHPDQSQWTQTILWTNCYSNAKEEAFCRFRKNCQPRFNPAFVFQHFTLLTAISLLCTHLRTVAKTNFCFMIQIAILVNLIYIFFSALRKYLPLKSAYFFYLCLAAKQPYLIPFSMVGHTCMAGTSHAQHYLRRAFARCSVSPQVRFISLSSARCSSPSAFSATQRSFYGVDSILAQSWESPDFPYMPTLPIWAGPLDLKGDSCAPCHVV